MFSPPSFLSNKKKEERRMDTIAVKDTFNRFLEIIMIAETIKSVKKNFNSTKTLQDRLIKLRTLLDNIDLIYKEIENKPELREAFSKLESTFDTTAITNKKNKHFRKLQTLLNSSTFSKTSSYFSYSGRSLAANNLMAICKEQLVPLFNFLGQVDVLLSSAKLMRNSIDKKAKYC